MNNGFKVILDDIANYRVKHSVPYATYAFYLTLFPLADSITYRIGMSFTDIANFLGTTRKTVVKYIDFLHGLGWLTYTDKHPDYPSGLIVLHMGTSSSWEVKEK